MKRISKNFFYTVYVKENDRVFKKENSDFHKLVCHIFGNRKGLPYIRASLARSKILAKNVPDQNIIAHPQFLDNYDYEQDKVVIIADYFAEHTIEENKKIIDFYIEHLYATWTYGFSDIIFNFSHNCGIDNEGRIVLVDFNEITFSKETIRDLVRHKRWLRNWTYGYLKRHKDVRVYFETQMEKLVTLSKIDEFWQDGSYE